MLVRSFPWLPGAADTEPGGALYVPRLLQGGNRHDNPARYGVLYASRDPVSAAAERLRAFRRWEIADPDFLRPDGSRYAVVTIDDAAVTGMVDLDDPAVLHRRNLRPSTVATRDRRTTRRLALELYDEGADGLAWWSTIEGAWINASLFAERAVPKLSVVGTPEVLTIDHPAVRAAAELLGLVVGATRPGSS